MRKGFVARVDRVIGQSDVVLEVVDARFPAETRNKALEGKVVADGKGLIIVVNKSDLIGRGRAKELKREIGKELRCVFFSARERQGKKKLLGEIGKASKGKAVKVAVVGYPNTGKSSVINVLKGRKAALTSRKAGFTRGEQIVRISEKILLVDSPGVIPTEEWDEFRLFLVGAKNPQDIEDKELAAMKLLEFISRENPDALRRRYGITAVSGERALEEIALRRKKLLKGGKPDTAAAATIVLGEWSKNILH